MAKKESKAKKAPEKAVNEAENDAVKGNTNADDAANTDCTAKQADTDVENNAVGESEGELNTLKEQLAQTKDLLLRTAAEYDNYKKRTARELERIGLESKANVISQILPAVDNFIRAGEGLLSNDTTSVEDYKKGIDMSIKQLFDLLKKIGVNEIDCVGKEFDPDLHFAVSRIEKEDAQPNTVADVFQKGYQLGDVVLRPAMVSVANCD